MKTELKTNRQYQKRLSLSNIDTEFSLEKQNYIIDFFYEENFSNILLIDQESFINNILNETLPIIKNQQQKTNNSDKYSILNFSLLNNKIQNIIQTKYEQDYSLLKHAIVEYETSENDNEYILKHFRKHCLHTSDMAIHKCSSSKFGKLIEIKNSQSNISYALCIECKQCYPSNFIKMYCNHCNEEYFSSKFKENEREDILPATWENYHCKPLINELMKCIKCRNILYIDLNSKNLICLNKNCNFTAKPESILWKCSTCNQEFYSSVKIYNPLENQLFKKAIIKSLLLQEIATPGKRMHLCKYTNNINELKYYHKKNCKGQLYKGIFKDKEIVVCDKCHAMNFTDKFVWTCPLCNKRFKSCHVENEMIIKKTNLNENNKEIQTNKNINIKNNNNDLNDNNQNNNYNNKNKDKSEEPKRKRINYYFLKLLKSSFKTENKEDKKILNKEHLNSDKIIVENSIDDDNFQHEDSYVRINNINQKTQNQFYSTPKPDKITDYKTKIRNKSGGKFTSKFYKNKKMLKKYETLVDIIEKRNNYIENQNDDEEIEKNDENIYRTCNNSNNSSQKNNVLVSKFNNYKNLRKEKRLVASMDFKSFSGFKKIIKPIKQKKQNINIPSILYEDEKNGKFNKKFIDVNTFKKYKNKYKTNEESEESLEKVSQENLSKINNMLDKQNSQNFNTCNLLSQYQETLPISKKMLTYKVTFGKSSAKSLSTNQIMSNNNTKTGNSELLIDKLITKKYKAENDQNTMTNTYSEGFFRSTRYLDSNKKFEKENVNNSSIEELSEKNDKIIIKTENKKINTEEKYSKPKIKNYFTFSHYKSRNSALIYNNNSKTDLKNITKYIKEEDKENVYQKKRTIDYDYEKKKKNNNDYDKNKYKNQINNNIENKNNKNINNENIKKKEEIKIIKKKIIKKSLQLKQAAKNKIIPEEKNEKNEKKENSYENLSTINEKVNEQNSNFTTINNDILLNEQNSAIYTEEEFFSNVKNCKIPFFKESDIKFIKCIGEGSHGKIYLVEEKKSGKQFALKRILCQDLNETLEFKEQFEMVYSLNHNNLVKIYNILFKYLDITAYSIFLLMEKAKYDWRTEINMRSKYRKFYNERELIQIMKQLVGVLSYFQMKNLTHRDIKPQNILVFEKKGVNSIYKITDLGEAKIAENISGMNTLKGSELFMAPNLFWALKYNNKEKVIHNVFKSDVFSLGYCFLFAMTLNINLIEALREITLMNDVKKIINKAVENRKYSKDFMEIIIKMVEVNEDDRYDFLELMNDLIHL